MENKLITPKTEPQNSKVEFNVSKELGKAIIDAKIKERKIENDEKKLERGWLGKFFGGKENSSNNIAGLFILILLGLGLLYTSAMLIYSPEDTHQQVLDFWGILNPLITLALGYIFGHHTKIQ